MTQLTQRERLHKALNGLPVDMTPVLATTQTGTKALMERSGCPWPGAHFDPGQMASLAVEGYRSIGFEAVRVPYCLTVLNEALGCGILRGEETRQPSIATHPYQSRKPLPAPEQDGELLSKGRIPVVCESLRRARDAVGPDVPLIAGAEGPATVASDLLEVTTFMKWTIKQREAVSDYLSFACESVLAYAQALLDAGADAFALLDPVASPELLNPRDFDDLLLPMYQELATRIDGDVVLHICGDVTQILPGLAETGFSAISIEEKTSIRDAKEAFGTKVRVVGNVSTSSTLFSGTPDESYAESIAALEAGTDVLAPGCGLAPMTPLENCRAMVRARNDFFRG